MLWVGLEENGGEEGQHLEALGASMGSGEERKDVCDEVRNRLKKAWLESRGGSESMVPLTASGS